MTENITASYVSSELETIRQTVAGKKSDIPFLLLPIRIEARFMKVDKLISSNSEGLLERLLGGLSALQVEFLKPIHSSSLNQIRTQISKISGDLKQIQKYASAITEVTRKQKTWLVTLSNELKTASQLFINSLNRPELRILRIQLTNERNNLLKSIDAINAVQDPVFVPVNEFLAKFKKIEKKLHNINNGKLPYTNPTNKKDLYSYIEKMVAELENLYKPHDNRIASIRRIKNNQLTKLMELHRKIQQEVLRLPYTIKSVHSDTAWKKFTKRNETQLQGKLTLGCQYFETTILPKLSHLAKIKHIDSDTLCYSSVRTLIDVGGLNSEKVSSNIKDVRKSRKKIKEKINAIRKMGEQIVEATPKQVEVIQDLWKKVDSSVNSYDKKINAANISNTSHAFSFKSTVGYLNGSSLSIRNSLYKSTEKETMILSSRDFADALEIFNQANTKAAQINSFLSDQNNTQINTEQLKTELTKLSNLFRVSARKRLPIADQSYQNTKKLIGNLNQKIERLNFHTDPDIKKEIDAIQSSIDLGAVVVDKPKNGLEDLAIQIALPTQQVNELWLRIFPDDIHIQTHEQNLTSDEIKDGQRFWLSWWAASNDHEYELAAWKALVSSHDSQRAAWIAKLCDPRSLSANNDALNKKPSVNILKIIDKVQTANKLLEKISVDMTAPAILTSIDTALIYKHIKSIQTLLDKITFEQENFIQQAYSQLRILESKLLIIETQLNASTVDELRPYGNEIANIRLIFTTYEKVRKRFQKIEILDINHFLDRFDKPLSFPRVRLKKQDWTIAPHTQALPDRIAILTMNDGVYKHIAIGNPIPEELIVGLNPQNFDFENENDNPFQLDSKGNLQVDEAMRWMVNFDDAVKKGMGLKIPLTDEEAEQGFDRVLAIGINDSTHNTDKQTLESLFNNHHYAPDGMSFLSVGTPTNNTEKSASGYNSIEDDPEESFRVEMGSELFDANENDQLKIADGKRFADALGIDPSVFQHLQYSDNQEISRAFAIHRSLWHVSIGDYMESSWDHLFNYDTIERTYQFFTNNVVGRGALPSLRVGTQPYGILPTTAFSKLRFHNTFDENNLPTLTRQQVESPNAATHSKLQLRYDIRLKQLLLRAKNVWESLHERKVKHAYNVPTDADEGDQNTLPTPQQHFIEMLGLQASSVEYFFRYGINIAYRGNDPENAAFSFNFKDVEHGPSFVRTFFNDIVNESYFYKSFDFLDEQHPNPDPDRQLADKSNRILDQFQDSRVFKSRYIDKYTEINGPIIDTQALSDTNSLEKNIKINNEDMSYIEWLLDGADSLYDILERNDFSKLPSNSVLFMLLRQSLLLAFREATMNIMQNEGFFDEPFRRTIGASNYYRLFNTRLKQFVYTSKWTFLFRDPKTFNGLKGIDFSKNEDGSNNRLYTHLKNGDRSLADFVLNKRNLFSTYPNRNQLQKYINRVEDIRSAIAVLDTIPTKALSQLLSEHIDVSSYRLDAWLLGLCHKRLQEQRNNGQEKGIYLGAYGWLEDLRPGGAREEAPNIPTELIPDDRTPVYTDADNEGYIHAPSINQAISAAVLRSGYTASREAIGDLDNQMAVNLSSRRVRMGLKLVEGISNGLSLGAILGFQFERNLHESYEIVELDRFVYRFRELFPLVVPIEITTQEAEPNPKVNVIDGYTLLQKVDDHIDSLRDVNTDNSIYDVLTENNFANCPVFIKSIVDSNLQPGDDRDLIIRSIIREIDRIGDALDALGDLTISESVYQIVQGNHVRAAAVVEALASGKAPPELQFINTPRTGVVVTHRAILNFEPRIATSSAPAGWPSTLTQKAKAEPSLNNWLASMFGPANQILCVAYNATQAPDLPLEISIDELGLHPIDLVYLLGFNAEQGSSELENRLAWRIRSKHSFSPDDTLKLSFSERPGHWSLNIKTIYELSPLIKHLKTMLMDVKYVDALDIMLPDDEPALDNPENLFPEDLKKRVTAAETDFRNTLNDIQQFLDANFSDMNDDTTVSVSEQNTIRDHLFNLAAFGIPNSIPKPVMDPKQNIGREFLNYLITNNQFAQKRLKAFDLKKNKLAEITKTRQITDTLIKMGRILLGKSMVLLPHYQPKNKADIIQQINLPVDSNLTRHRTDPHVLTDWLQDLSNIRPGLYAMDMSSMLAQNFNQQFPDFQPVQFPYADNDYWLGLEYPADEFKPEGDYLSLALFDHKQLTSNGNRKVGIIVDEWTEIIPHKEEVTGIVYHYDQPDAQAPQSLLLAVSPDTETKWNWNNLVHILNETLDLAKIRAVEPDHLDDSIFAQILPSIAGEVVPPQAREYDDDDSVTDKPFRNPLGTQVVMDFVDNLPGDDGN
ncbi:MAG: hypothetical protein BBJ57_10045 [Desulfobacterales bacterium PC51MH44]|nr:MAG: hypothetical protein BBJ57_10045 [Desulfobacterales bacterium PC51MH44]